MAHSTDAEQSLAAAVHRRTSRLLAAAVGVPTLMLGGLVLRALPGPWSSIGTGVLLAMAALACGLLLGFLFGIPRSVQVGAAANGAGADGRLPGGTLVNTNLEQISDWLTKILVGIGLIELTRIAPFLGELVTEVGEAFGGPPDGRVVAGTILVSFTVTGFLLGYIGTRTMLTRIFARFDVEDLRSLVDERVTEHLDEDAGALRLVIQQLDESQPAPEYGRLHRALENASSSIRGQILVLADRLRKESWRDPATRARHDRTIAVFDALTRISPSSARYWGALGFALKDRTPPDNRAALTALNHAIELRGDPITEGKEYYEFARAIVRVRLLDGAEPDERRRAAIVRDASVAWRNREIQDRVRRAQEMTPDDADDADVENLHLVPTSRRRSRPRVPGSPARAGLSKINAWVPSSCRTTSTSGCPKWTSRCRRTPW